MHSIDFDLQVRQQSANCLIHWEELLFLHHKAAARVILGTFQLAR